MRKKGYYRHYNNVKTLMTIPYMGKLYLDTNTLL